MNPTPCASSTPDPLLELELRIARRADELTLAQGIANSLNLHCWLVAEYEVIGPAGLVAASDRQLSRAA
jgi:hypothetical protein